MQTCYSHDKAIWLAMMHVPVMWAPADIAILASRLDSMSFLLVDIS